MSKHFLRQIDRLKDMILQLGDDVEQSVDNAIRAFNERDKELARKVIEHDRQVDLMEIEMEEECLHTLALHQPVALDLRFVVSMVKINSDLERIADLAVNIAEQALFFAREPHFDDIPFDFEGETQRVRSMVRLALESLVNNDVEAAQKVREMDDEVDVIHRDMYHQIEDAIRRNPEDVNRLINLLVVSRQLERIADHAVNIAEDVIYMAQGEILRHTRRHAYPKQMLSGGEPRPGHRQNGD